MVSMMILSDPSFPSSEETYAYSYPLNLVSDNNFPPRLLFYIASGSPDAPSCPNDTSTTITYTCGLSIVCIDRREWKSGEESVVLLWGHCQNPFAISGYIVSRGHEGILLAWTFLIVGASQMTPWLLVIMLSTCGDRGFQNMDGKSAILVANDSRSINSSMTFRGSL